VRRRGTFSHAVVSLVCSAQVPRAATDHKSGRRKAGAAVVQEPAMPVRPAGCGRPPAAMGQAGTPWASGAANRVGKCSLPLAVGHEPWLWCAPTRA
jgi:hypothetical protein